AISGVQSLQVFENFVDLAEATLTALPEQVKAVGATGRFAADPPETAETFARIRRHYENGWLGADRCERVWPYFGEAFALLLEATAPGLWGEPNSLNIAGPLSGPDILGYLYQTWANGSRAANGAIYSPWPVARLMAELTLGQNGERLVYDRLKEALCHPDNILGAAVLLAGLVVPEDEPGAMRDYFITRVVPACGEFFKPVSVCDPAIGSSILNLAAASIMPEWMVKMGLIIFAGQDISRIAVSVSRVQAKAYGLNGYALQLEAAVLEALQARQQAIEQPSILPQSPTQIIRDVYQNEHAPPMINGTGPSFEQMFKAAAITHLA
ncbi:MAG: hypothetical protein GY796_24480, partial [Chloroflexi bacterium]|nr:hypothetical protein [Chloroflexota bacterium]